jgi:hypothetical protein
MTDVRLALGIRWCVYHLFKERAKAARPLPIPSRRDLNLPISSVRKVHDQAIAHAGIAEHFRLYDLRNTFESRASANGTAANRKR